MVLFSGTCRKLRLTELKYSFLFVLPAVGHHLLTGQIF
ncbi:MAG: hypothetical protein AVDCRST_MAG95-1274 [uncultured Adhaeribacter sp.]|uniref:Uncharacterized protein n=1 Tax=uncultured Adhaeribacter sp. TaxID=448109 RepID=A0A6J4HY50_9BACT|nr:MAG: hypothetical protein AVDCRST_MAG95-1274 [uncultured Adhaeribacter sp.]